MVKLTMVVDKKTTDLYLYFNIVNPQMSGSKRETSMVNREPISIYRGHTEPISIYKGHTYHCKGECSTGPNSRAESVHDRFSEVFSACSTV